MKEKRQYPRDQTRLTVWLITSDLPQPVIGYLRNLSIGGAFIESTAAVAFGNEVTIQVIFPPPLEPQTVQAIVRWVDADGFGVQFGLMGAKQTHAIAQVLRQRRAAQS